MAKLEGISKYSQDMKRLEPTTPAHADYFNDRYQILLNNDAFLFEQLNKTNNKTIQAASKNLITNILLVNLADPESAWNQPGIVSKEFNTSGDFPPGCLWGIREVFWHSTKNLTVKVTGFTDFGDSRIWTRSYAEGDGWGAWSEPVGLLLKHTDSGDHDGRYYTESEIDSLLSTINTQLADCLKSVGDGKTVVANAITAQGVSTATDAAFSTLAANVTTACNTRYNTGYSSGVTDADNRSNPASNNYKTGYNAGIMAADARVNTSSASYTMGYNNGVAAADNRANASSVNYKTGYNAGVSDVKNNPGVYSLYTKAQYDANYKTGYNAGVTAGEKGKYIVKTGSFTASPGSNEARNYEINPSLTSIKAVYYMSDSNDFSVIKISNTECRVWARFGGSTKISWVAYGS